MMKDNLSPRDISWNSSSTFEESSYTAASNWSAVRSALVAEVLRRGDGQRVRGKIQGESMLPALWPGDVVEIESCRPEDLRTGAIVLAQRDDRLVLHRLVGGVGADSFMLRGDCVRAADPEYPADALLGRLVGGVSGQPGGLIAEWLGAKLSRSVGILFCYCGLARRVALRLHSRRRAWTRDSLIAEDSAKIATVEMNSGQIASGAGAS